jgi:hypothetical protein
MTTWTEEAILEVRHVIGEIDDAKLTAILALNPSFEEIEEAVMWADGRAQIEGNSRWPLVGKVGEIFEILTADLEDEAFH